MKKWYAFILILLIGYLPIKAQEVLVKHITKAMGLPSNKIYAINQDKKGYIWLGTERGLVKYDGNSFHTYTHPSMNGYAVSDVQEDKLGRIWCQNFIGQHFYFEHDSLKYFEELGASGIYSPMSIDAYNNLFFFGQKHLRVSNLQLKRLDSILVNDYLTYSFIYQKNLHFFSNGVIYSYEKGRVKTIGGHLSKAPSYAQTFSFVLKDGIYTFPKPVAGKYLYKIYPDFKAIPLPCSLGGLLQSVTVLRDSIVCLNTTSGTQLLNESFKPLMYSRILPKYSISSVCMDTKGRYWISSTDGGLFLLESLKKYQWQVQENGASCLSDYGTKNMLLIGNNKGDVYQLNQESKRVTKFVSFKGNNTLRKLIFSTNQQRLIGLNDYLIVLEKKKEIIRYPAAVKDLVPLKKNSLAFAATGLCGLVVLNSSQEMDPWKSHMKLLFQKNGNKVYQFTYESLSLRNQAIQYDDAKDRFFIATSKGVLEFNREGKEHELKHKGQSIIADKLCIIKGKLLALSANKGLYLEGKEGFELLPSFTMLSQQHLSDVKLFENEVYLLAENGVYKLSPENWKIHPIYFTSSEEELLSFELTKEYLYVLSESGLQALPIANQAPEDTIPLEITHFLVNKQTVAKGTSLSYTQNNVRINFQFPWYGLSSFLNIKYRINQGPWTGLPAESRSLEFFSLSPGNYTVELMAGTITGKKSNTESVYFEILEPIWKRWWFYLSLVLVSAGIMGVFYSYRIKQIRIRTKLLEQNIRLESNLRQSMLTSIKAQMNPHFVFNALNSIQSYIYLNDKQNATRFLSKFSSLTRKILEMSSEEYVSIDDELSALKLYLELEKMRFEEVFEYSLEYGSLVEMGSLRLPSMIIQPYVENAIKHGLLHKEGKRELHIRFQWENPYLLVEIEDNGIGREASGKLNRLKQGHHKSFASSANQKRLELLQKQEEQRLAIEYHDKVDTEGNACGTLVKLSIRATYSSHNPAS